MDGPLGIAIFALLVAGLVIKLAVAFRNRNVKGYLDEEKDAESFATELDLQLLGELDDAIKSSSPLISSGKGSLVDVSPYESPLQVRFAEEEDDGSSWTTFKRESRAKLQQLGKGLNLVSADDVSFHDATDAMPNGHIQPLMSERSETPQQRFLRRQLPLLDSDGALAERNVLVNAKQYSRILKRRYARQLMEDYFRSQPKRTPAMHGFTGSMRRPRGPDGRFLTPVKILRMEAGPMVNGVAAH